MHFANLTKVAVVRLYRVAVARNLIDDVNPSRSLLCEARMTVRAARRSGEVLQRETYLNARRGPVTHRATNNNKPAYFETNILTANGNDTRYL